MEWYPFYPAIYRQHTMHLTAEQDGIYRRLIDYYMETRIPLPDNDTALARIAGIDIACFKHASSMLRAFFNEQNGLLYHQKCDELLQEQDNKAKFYAKRAKKAAMTRHGKTKELCLKHAKSNQQAFVDDATIRDNSKEIRKKVSKERISPLPPLAIKPEGVTDEAWCEFLEMRKRNKAKNTDYALRLLLNKIKELSEAGDNPQELVEQSIRNAWKDIYPLKTKDKQKRHTDFEKQDYYAGTEGFHVVGATRD